MFAITVQPSFQAETRSSAAAAALSRAVRAVLGRLESAFVETSADVEALLEKAARYEATQPSYAADLRAAAQRGLTAAR